MILVELPYDIILLILAYLPQYDLFCIKDDPFLDIFVKEIYVQKEITNLKELEKAFMEHRYMDIIYTQYKFNVNYGIGYAGKSGSMELIQLMIEKGANDWNLGLRYACLGGSMEIVQLMIDKGANNWYWCLESACKGGSMEIVQLMIEKGAKREEHYYWYCNCMTI